MLSDSTSIMNNCHDRNPLDEGYSLGQLLARSGLLASEELDFIRDECEGLADAGQAMKMAAGVRQRLGELLCEARHITPEQLDLALAQQKRTGQQLGAILVQMAFLTQSELDATLAFQTQQSNHLSSNRLKLGEILIASGLITLAQLEDALERQNTSGRPLGEELIAAGHIEPLELERSLHVQRKLVAAMLALVLVFASGSRSSPAYAGQQQNSLQVMAVVQPSVRVKSEYQATEIEVTSEDIARGYVDVRVGTRFRVRITKNSSYAVDIYPRLDIFTAVTIDGLGSPMQIGPNGGTIVVGRGKASIALAMLGYRFVLNENARPGRYPWPLALHVRPFP